MTITSALHRGVTRERSQFTYLRRFAECSRGTESVYRISFHQLFIIYQYFSVEFILLLNKH